MASEKGRPSHPHSHSPIHPLKQSTIQSFIARARTPWPRSKGVLALASRLHARLGDFWWYSLMIFMAARAADCLNVFVGLWLVPKYVQPSELGAVQPLANFASFLALPAAIFASTFRQELSNLAVTNQFGKMKTLMRSVFIATAVFLFLAIVVSHFVLPHFLERIRIAEGSLGILIIVYSFISTIAPIFQNALQSLKKFKATTVISLLGAPIRLIAMLATVPLRALSGYFIGQTSTPAFSIVTSVIALRKELSVKADTYWTIPTFRRFSKLFLIFGASSVVGGITALVETTILRQRLPDIESAGYYMATRFSDIANFLPSAILFTVFPFAAKLAASGKSTTGLVVKSAIPIIILNGILAIFFGIFGKEVLKLLPNGNLYGDYAWSIPWLIANCTIVQITAIYTSAEVSANRFRYLFWSIPLGLLYAALMIAITGYGYFKGYLPESMYFFLEAHNITSLKDILIWFTVYNAIRLVFCMIDELTKISTIGYVTTT